MVTLRLCKGNHLVFQNEQNVLRITCLTFNPFQENTYVLSDATGECIIIDPGCSSSDENAELEQYIRLHHLKPVMLVQTHCHIDHVLGNHFVFDKWGLAPVCHQLELPLLEGVVDFGRMFGVKVMPSPLPLRFIDEGDEIRFGETVLKVLFTPGHSPGSVCLYNEQERVVIAGDVLFRDSIGRYDLPGGDFATLENSIRTKLYTLDPSVKVWPGHGPSTTIGYEMKNNPFVNGIVATGNL